MFSGTCSSTEMPKGYMARESLGTPDDAIICLKQLRGIIIETPVVIAIEYICIQMIKGS